MTALRKEMFRMCLLKICAADFAAGNLRGDRQDWDTITVTIVKSVDEMQVARSATTAAYGKVPRQKRFGTCSECGRFLMSDRHPGDVISWPNGISDSVERISGYSQHSFNACCDECVNENVRDSLFSHMLGLWLTRLLFASEFHNANYFLSCSKDDISGNLSFACDR
jgi:hypothetical protein